MTHAPETKISKHNRTCPRYAKHKTTKSWFNSLL